MTMPSSAPRSSPAQLSTMPAGRPIGVGDDCDLLVPVDDAVDPEVTILVPAVNEQLTITEFVGWCHEGLAASGLRGEVLIVDSSTDRTPELALAAGARVLKTPKRGLGRAYIDAIPYVRGTYVVMGDADLTYDFRQVGLFVQKLREGYDFAMGSRWAGSIEDGSMPALHRYFGTPFTTWILNRVYGSRFTDIHCGMRGITLDALKRMGLNSQSWEYASEMVLKSVRMGLRTAEVPVTFYKDREGRLSHHKRSGWSSPFRAAWINLRAMFVYGADFFMIKPGIVLLVCGLVLSLPLSFGSIRIGAVTFALYWMLIGVALAVIGLQSFFFGCLAQVLCDYSGAARTRWMRVFSYTRSILVAMALSLTGFVLEVVLLANYLDHGGHLPPATSRIDHAAVIGLLFLIMGFSLFCFTLVLHATGVRYGLRTVVTADADLPPE